MAEFTLGETWCWQGLHLSSWGEIKTKWPKVLCPIKKQDVLVFPSVAWAIKDQGPGALQKNKINVSKGPQGSGG